MFRLSQLFRYFILGFLFLSFFSLKAQFNLPLNEESTICKVSKDLAVQKAFFESNSVNQYNVYYQELNLKINPEQLFISGAVAFHYQTQTALSSLELHLSDSLTVDSVKRGTQVLSFTHNNHKILVQTGNLVENQKDSVLIYYHGVPDQEKGCFFRSYQEGAHLNPVIATLSEPYNASEWWPCKNTLTDKLDSVDINILCPSQYKAASQGLLTHIDSAIIDGHIWHTYHWKHRYPVAAYLISIAVSNYKEYHKYIHLSSGDSIYFMNYIYQDDDNWEAIDTTASIMQIYDSLFIPYPFSAEKYGHARFPWGGGMEHQTLSSMGGFSYRLIAHELAHQWFGDYITCGTWLDLWLNESFATYCTDLCMENEPFPDKEGFLHIYRTQRMNYICSEPTGSVLPTDTSDFSNLFSSRLTYKKGAAVLRMLRWTIGDEAFFQALRNYLSDPNLAYSFSRTSRLVHHFEQVADTNLSAFMNDWYYGESFPIFQLEYTRYDNSNALDLKLSQHSADGQESKFFDLYVPVRLYGESDTLDLRLHHQTNGQEYHFSPGFYVKGMAIDPDVHIITKDASVINSIEKKHIGDIVISPNPSRGMYHLYGIEQIENLQIYNLQGQSCNYYLKNNVLDISCLPSGYYYIYIRSAKHTFVKKLIKI